jgi:lysophospholipase L1-like esterase
MQFTRLFTGTLTLAAAQPLVDRGRRRFASLAAALVIGAGLGFAGPAPAADDTDWVGTWATSPQTQSATQTPRQFPAGTTVRQIVRISKGGTEFRVRLSNELGTQPLVVGRASIARHQSGGLIIAGTNRPVTFSGQSSVTIPAGAPVLSDPISLDAPPLSDVAISIHLPNGASGTTFHSVGLQTNYIGPANGDYTSSVIMPTAATARNYWFLTALNVRAESNENAKAIVALGDSITDGTNSTPDTNARWPNILAMRLQESANLKHIGVLNEGISGNRLLSEPTGPAALSRFDRDVLSHSSVKYLVVLIGINDIGNSARGTGPAVTADEIIMAHRQIIARAKAKGIKVYGATLTPIQGSGYDFPIAEANRQTVNAWIRTSGEYDAVIDFDEVTRDPAQPTRFLPEYDSGDHLHPNNAGYTAMGRSVPLSLFQ